MKMIARSAVADRLIHWTKCFGFLLIVGAVLVPLQSHCLTTNSVGAVQYTAFDNSVYVLQPWLGRNVAFLTPTNRVLDTNIMGALLTALDSAWDYYKSVTLANRSPTILPSTTLYGRDTIAVVNSTCGAGCSYVGYTGTEMLPTYFDVLYDGYVSSGEFDQVLFYEFGRNWWSYDAQLTYHAPDIDPIVTGYAVYMRFASMDAAGVNGAPFNGYSFVQFRTAVTNLMDDYITNPSLNWSNTFSVSKAPGNSLGLGGTDLFASLLMRIGRDFGGTNFNQNIWKQVAQRRAAFSTQGAVDNLILAASATVKTNLTYMFARNWKFPVSTNAVQEAQLRWGNPFVIRPTLQASTLASTNLTVKWRTEWNNLYQVQASADGLTWTNIGPSITGTGGFRSVTYPATGLAPQFYRLRLL